MAPVGGGELARETEVDVIDTLSGIETCSLDGVPGTLMEARLGLRDGNLLAAAEAPGVAGGAGGGVSAFGVWTTRSVLGAVLMAGDAELPPGLSGTLDEDEGVCETVRCALLGVFGSLELDAKAEVDAPVPTAAVMSNLPGCFRFGTSIEVTLTLLGVAGGDATSCSDCTATSLAFPKTGLSIDSMNLVGSLLSSAAICSGIVVAFFDDTVEISLVLFPSSSFSVVFASDDVDLVSAAFSSMSADEIVLDARLGVFNSAFDEGPDTVGLEGSKGSAGVTVDAALFTLVLLDGRDEGRESSMSSGNGVGRLSPGGTIGVERRLSLLICPSNPGGTGGVDLRDSSARERDTAR